VRRFRAARLRRRDTDLYELLARSARNLVTGADLLAELALPGADASRSASGWWSWNTTATG